MVACIAACSISTFLVIIKANKHEARTKSENLYVADLFTPVFLLVLGSFETGSDLKNSAKLYLILGRRSCLKASEAIERSHLLRTK